MIVKNSLALSLGLVGALSIVRFRAAINQAEGFARQSRFAIRIFPPSNISVFLINLT